MPPWSGDQPERPKKKQPSVHDSDVQVVGIYVVQYATKLVIVSTEIIKNMYNYYCTVDTDRCS